MNGIPLIGETHKEVVNILKELPMRVCLVCSRILPPVIPDSDEEDDDDVRLTLKELLAEFNDKVKAPADKRTKDEPHQNCYTSSAFKTPLENTNNMLLVL